MLHIKAVEGTVAFEKAFFIDNVISNSSNSLIVVNAKAVSILKSYFENNNFYSD